VYEQDYVNGEAHAYPPIFGLFPVSPFFTFPHSLADLSLAYAPVIEDIRPFLGILAGIVGSVFLVALIIVIVVRVRGSSGRDRNNYSHPGSGVVGVGGTTTGNGSGMGGVGGVGGMGGTTANGNGSLGLLASNNNEIECIEGFDGGLQQDFIMEVYMNGTTRHPKISKSK